MAVNNLREQVNQLGVSNIARLIYRFIPWRRTVIENNIAQAFDNELSAQEQSHLAKAFYTHLLRCLKEMLWMRLATDKMLRNSVEIRGYERLLEIAAEGKGVLILTGHFGNWEFAPIAGIMNFKAFQGQFHFIRRTLGIKWLEKILFRRYYKAGLKVIPKKNSLHQVCDALTDNHAVVFVLDQHASLVNRDGIAAEFFGRKAGTYRSLASFARHTGVPVIPAASYRVEGKKHVLEFKEPLLWEEKESVQASIYHNTCQYNQAIEAIIREHPEQWLWLHKRWKLKDN